MIACIFTLDYEIYGNGEGALRDLVYEPTVRLQKIFQKWDAKFVVFAEVAEFEKIEKWRTDPAIGPVKQQLRDLYQDGFEIGLHLHPQWCNARYDQGRWLLDSSEYNLCTLPPARIAEIVDHSIDYLRHVVGQTGFTPLSFRAGNWLFQPTEHAATVLSQKGIRIDSSVFKGGLQRNGTLDYRRALRNGYYWSFASDVNEPDPIGPWIEVPVYTEMVPSWRMATKKRLGFTNNGRRSARSARQKLNRAIDLLRFRYPLKLDFCRMTLDELTSMVDRVIQEDREEPTVYRPLVAIGHTKDLTDPDTVDAFLSFLRASGVAVSTFETAHPKLLQESPQATSHRVDGRDSKVQVPNGDLELKSDLVGVVSSDNVRPPGAGLKYVLITPARNEAAFIEQTMKSVVVQTLRPVKWVIVSDGSTDGTDEIVNKYASKNNWIELVRMPERKERHFAGKVHAFNAGYARVGDLGYDVIGNLDADITFDEKYFDFLLRRFAEHPQLGVAGTPFREESRQYDYRFTSSEHVSGACQLFRRECFEQIGGYAPIKTGGIDLVAVVTARMKGWQTRSFLEKTCNHHRKMGAAKHNALISAFEAGRTDYTHGCYIVWELFRCAYQMTRRPLVLGGSLCLAGFVWAMVTGTEKVVAADVVQFRRSEQMRRLRDFFQKALPWRLLKTSSQYKTNRYECESSAANDGEKP